MKAVRTVAIVLGVMSFVFCWLILVAIGAPMKFSNSILVGLTMFGVAYGIGALIVRSRRR